MAPTENAPGSEAPSTTCHLPLGYDGVLRIRAAPRINLTPERKDQPAPRDLNDWPVQIGGECRNVIEPIPCRLEWIIQGDSLADKRASHPRETWLVPKGKVFQVLEKDATGHRPLRVSILELGLIGTGRMGYRIEPSLFGNEAVEVLPTDPKSIAYALKADIRFSPLAPAFEEKFQKAIGLLGMHVGSGIQLEPDFCELFKGLQATVDIHPTPPEGLEPDEQARVRMEWVVGDSATTGRLRWKVGFASTPGDEEGEWNEDHLLATGGVESTPKLAFQYQLTLTRPPPPAPEKKEKSAQKPAAPLEQLRPLPRPALTVDRPRLTDFTVSLNNGELAIQGAFEGFHENVALDLQLTPYVLYTEGDTQRLEELGDYLEGFLLELLSERLSNAGDHSRAPRNEDFFFLATCSPDDIQTRLAPLENLSVTSRQNRFQHTFFNLKSLPREDVQALKKVKGLEVFVVLTPLPHGADKNVPVWAIADYAAREGHNASVGFAPFDSGAFVSRVFASGVCSSNSVTPSGHIEALYSPMPVVPADRREEFEIFVATICGEAIGQSPTSWAGVAHTIMNRVGRKYEIWERCLSAAEIIQNTGFEAYQKKIYQEAIQCIRAPAHSQMKDRDKVKAIIDVVTPIFMRQAGNMGDVVYFYSPKAQSDKGRSTPAFVSQGGDKTLVCINNQLFKTAPEEKRPDDFLFYAFKYPEKWPHQTQEELRQTRKARAEKKSA
ncbi:hypothetical protein D187_003817 [Cystobacter fuscus DSM 2262]|uniref:Uncharacterized protein n=1 Tax=Cystobacter fuscus (strain ATCC 25194 / DSM 2262 / NBRC 100088 / M29) TaxID=1242864 RepID=S9QBF5_CYSF2|nr:hypothetical protein [Cystobacter fuscus]EPX58619.1 hypothetical protein D187_003817 [Cystobacter fuscus DSM 2262]